NDREQKPASQRASPHHALLENRPGDGSRVEASNLPAISARQSPFPGNSFAPQHGVGVVEHSSWHNLVLSPLRKPHHRLRRDGGGDGCPHACPCPTDGPPASSGSHSSRSSS